jgi:hypothetical protein
MVQPVVAKFVDTSWRAPAGAGRPLLYLVSAETMVAPKPNGESLPE